MHPNSQLMDCLLCMSCDPKFRLCLLVTFSLESFFLLMCFHPGLQSVELLPNSYPLSSTESEQLHRKHAVSMVSPDMGLVSMVRQGILALQLLPPNSSSGTPSLMLILHLKQCRYYSKNKTKNVLLINPKQVLQLHRFYGQYYQMSLISKHTTLKVCSKN